MIKKAKDSMIEVSKELLGGEPVFQGTRVPVRTLIDYLKSGDRLEDFLKDFPTVTKAQAIDMLESFKRGLKRG